MYNNKSLKGSGQTSTVLCIGKDSYNKRRWAKNRLDSGSASWMPKAIRRSGDNRPYHGEIKILVQNGIVLQTPIILPSH